MSDELKAHLLWPTMLFTAHWPEHDRYVDALRRFVYDLAAEQDRAIASDVAPSAKAASGLTESDLALFERSHPALDALKRFIGATVQSVVSRVNGGTVPPRRIRVDVTDSWFHITRDGGFHDAHAHPGCSWCGIYYLQIGDSGRAAKGGAPNGLNRFYAPISTGGATMDYGAAYLNATYADPPIEDGAMIVFPSYLMHSGLPYRGARDRVIISFNSRSYIAEPTAAKP